MIRRSKTEHLLRSYLHQIRIPGGSEADERIIRDASLAMRGAHTCPRGDRPRAMNITMTRLTILFLAILGGLGLAAWLLTFQQAQPSAYALSQTIDALKRIRYVHLSGRDWEEKRIEAWIKTNAQTGLIDCCHASLPDEDRIIISTPNTTFDYDRRSNLIRIKDGPSIASILCTIDFYACIERMAESLEGKLLCSQVTDVATMKQFIELKMSAPRVEIVSLIDPRTKLPSRIEFTRGGKFRECDLIKCATEIQYDVEPPEDFFEFAIPSGASISNEAMNDYLQELPEKALEYCHSFHLETARDVADVKRIPVNTRIYFIDPGLKLHDGGIAGIRNDSAETWSGEMGIFNTDYPNMALFEIPDGKKQHIRLLQNRPSPPGRFRVYLTIDPPIPAGETRYFIYWSREPRDLSRASDGQVYQLTMNNRFGAEAIENFILVMPAGMEVRTCSSECTRRREIAASTVMVWQRHVAIIDTVNEVVVSLSPPR